MPADLPAALANEAAVPSAEIQAERWGWVETALTLLLAAAAVLLVSFISVVTNL